MKYSNLVIYHCRSKVMEIPAVYTSIGLGTAPDNDIKLIGEGIRPHHLVIRRRGKQWYAISRGNGKLTTEEGIETKQARLSYNSKIMFGNYSLEINEEIFGESTSTDVTTSSSPAAAEAREILLTVNAEGERVARQHPFSGNLISIGRDPSNHIVIHDKFCSSFHALIEKSKSHWSVIDLGSKNGLIVDGRKVVGCKLSDASQIHIGKTTILCEFPRSEESCDDFIVTPGIKSVLQKAKLYARSDFPVLITGESGTGKEMIAQYLHRESSRRGGRFIPVNCGAIPETLAESLLFGHKRGAFTGALENHEGFVGAADGGTLVLDEIGELPLTVQAKLLRMLDRGLFTQVGDTQMKKVDIRIVSSTNRNLIQMIHEGKFREDLYHRLAVLPLGLSPLRKRIEDVEPLTLWILKNIKCADGWKRTESISTSALEKLRSYWWPGNIRELRNVLFKASMNAGGGAILPEHIEFVCGSRLKNGPLWHNPEDLKELMVSCDWKIATAAKLTGIPRTTLRYHLRKSGILRNN